MNSFYNKHPPDRIHPPGEVIIPQLGENSVLAIEISSQATSPLRKANATASDRLATPNLERMLLT